MMDLTYQQVIARAAAIKEAFGESSPTIYLRDPQPPYSKAATFDANGTYRLGINTSGYFSCYVQGIECKWSFDLEGWGANGTGQLAPRIDAIRDVLASLEGVARQQFREWLVAVATKVRNDAAELRGVADDQAAKAAILADIAGATE